MRKHDVISINRHYTFSETALEKEAPAGQQWCRLQVLGFRCQVSGVREPARKILTPEH